MKPDDVILAAVFLGEPFEIKPLVTLVGHDHATELGIAPDERSQQAVHARGLAGTGVTGKEKVTVGLVARPLEPRERENNPPAIGHDFARRIADETTMIRIVEE